MERQNSVTLHHSAWTNLQNIGLNLSFKSFKSRLQLVRIYILHCLWLNNKHSSLSIIITWQLFYSFSFIILTGTSFCPTGWIEVGQKVTVYPPLKVPLHHCSPHQTVKAQYKSIVPEYITYAFNTCKRIRCCPVGLWLFSQSTILI